MPAAAEVDEGDQGGGGVEAEAAVADQADLAVEAFEAAVGEAEADGGEDAVAVAAEGAREPDERRQPRARRPGQPGVEVRGRERGVGEVVEQPQLFAQQEGAVERLVGAAGPRRACASWRIVWCSGALSSDQRVPLIQRPVRGVRALVGVPLVAADLVDGAVRRGGRRGTGQSRSRRRGRRRGSRAGTRRSCRSRPPGSSRLRSPSSSKNACKVALLRPGAHHTIAPVAWSTTVVR